MGGARARKNAFAQPKDVSFQFRNNVQPKPFSIQGNFSWVL